MCEPRGRVGGHNRDSGCLQPDYSIECPETVQKWYEEKGDAMKILFHGDHAFSKDIEEFIYSRCEPAFDRFDSVIRDIKVTVRDENGPRGGDDIRCIIQIAMTGLADVIVHDQAESVKAAVGEAIDRAAYQVSRRLNRHKSEVRKAVLI